MGKMMDAMLVVWWCVVWLGSIDPQKTERKIGRQGEMDGGELGECPGFCSLLEGFHALQQVPLLAAPRYLR